MCEQMKSDQGTPMTASAPRGQPRLILRLGLRTDGRTLTDDLNDLRADKERYQAFMDLIRNGIGQ